MGTTPKLDQKFFDETLCYTSIKESSSRKQELCSTLIAVGDSRQSPLLMREASILQTTVIQPADARFRVLYQIQDTKSYENVNEKQHTECLECGRSVDCIKSENADKHMGR